MVFFLHSMGSIINVADSMVNFFEEALTAAALKNTQWVAESERIMRNFIKI